MRVIMLIDSLAPGGAEKSTVALAAALAQRQLDLSIVTLRSAEDGFSDEARRAGVEVRTLRRGSWLSQVRQLRRMLRSEQPDIVHTALFASDQIGRLAAAGLPVPVISSLVSVPQALPSPKTVLGWKLRIVRWIDTATSHLLVEHFHAVTTGVAAEWIDRLHLPASRVTIVERGRSAGELGRRTPERRERVRHANGWSPDEYLVVAVGRHEPDKAQVDLISAFALLLSLHPASRLVIAGRPGSETASIAHAIEANGLSGRVELLGHRNDVADLIATADVLVSSSTREGAAGAVIEAMAIGTPIVSTMLPGLAGVLEGERNSLTVAPHDIEQLAEAIERVRSEPGLADRLSTHATGDYESRFTLDRSAEGMVDLYQRCLRAARG